MKTLFSLFFTFSFLLPLYANSNECVNCQAQQRSIQSSQLPQSVCENMSIDIRLAQAKQLFWHIATKNNPRATAMRLANMSQIANQALSCGLISSCRDLSQTTRVTLASGWQEIKRGDFIETQGTNGPECLFVPEYHVEKENTLIRGVISNQGHLSFYLPSQSCSQGSTEIHQSIAINEVGLFISKDNSRARGLEGQWLLLKKKRNPQLNFLANGNVQVTMADGAYVEVSSQQNKAVSSNLLSNSFFNQNLCQQSNRSLSLPLNAQASTLIHHQMSDRGGVAVERALEQHRQSVPRQRLNP